MSFLTPLAFLALITLPIVVILHLRRPQRRVVDIPSLLPWHGLIDHTPQKARHFQLASLPLLLLQLLILTLLAGSLARPVTTAAPPLQRAAQVYIVDDSIWMSAIDLAPNRLSVARNMIAAALPRATPGTRFSVIVASSQPYLLVSTTDRRRVRRALASVRSTDQQADFITALRLAAGVMSETQRAHEHLTILRAPESTVPSPLGLDIPLSAVTIGRSSDNQSITRFSVRCPIASRQACLAFATVRNENDRPIRDTLIIRGNGDPLARQPLSLLPRADTNVSFAVPQGQRIIQLQLTRPDILPADNSAWYVIGSDTRLHITLIGQAQQTSHLQQALTALPGISLRVGRPRQYRPAEAEQTDLLILDGWRPPGSLPPAPSLLLIDPPSLPGGRVAGSPPDATISGENSASPLLSGVDLTSLDIPPEVAEVIHPPPWSAPTLWDASGPLLSAGQYQGQRVAILAFDPARTNLPQLTAYPVLLWNIVRWSAQWLPSSAVPGERTLLIPAPATIRVQVAEAISGHAVATLSLLRAHPVTFVPPHAGVYSVTESSPAGSRTALLAANVEATRPPVPAVLHLELTSVVSGRESLAPRSLRSWWPWIGLLALLLLVLEWLVVTRREA